MLRDQPLATKAVYLLIQRFREIFFPSHHLPVPDSDDEEDTEMSRSASAAAAVLPAPGSQTKAVTGPAASPNTLASPRRLAVASGAKFEYSPQNILRQLTTNRAAGVPSADQAVLFAIGQAGDNAAALATGPMVSFSGHPQLYKQAKGIIDTYIMSGSPMEINVISHIKRDILRAVQQGGL